METPIFSFKYFLQGGALDKTNDATEVQKSKNREVPEFS